MSITQQEIIDFILSKKFTLTSLGKPDTPLHGVDCQTFSTVAGDRSGVAHLKDITSRMGSGIISTVGSGIQATGGLVASVFTGAASYITFGSVKDINDAYDQSRSLTMSGFSGTYGGLKSVTLTAANIAEDVVNVTVGGVVYQVTTPYRLLTSQFKGDISNMTTTLTRQLTEIAEGFTLYIQSDPEPPALAAGAISQLREFAVNLATYLVNLAVSALVPVVSHINNVLAIVDHSAGLIGTMQSLAQVWSLNSPPEPDAALNLAIDALDKALTMDRMFDAGDFATRIALTTGTVLSVGTAAHAVPLRDAIGHMGTAMSRYFSHALLTEKKAMLQSADPVLRERAYRDLLTYCPVVSAAVIAHFGTSNKAAGVKYLNDSGFRCN